MSDKLDKPLGDIIAEENKSRPRRGGRGGAGRSFSSRGRRNNNNNNNNQAFKNPLARDEDADDGAQPNGDGYGPQRRQRSNFRAAGPYSGGADGGSWSHDMYASGQPRQIQRPSGVGFKVLVSNLDSQVTDSDLAEIFTEVGGVQYAHVNFDSSNKHLGTAEVSFGSRQQAETAVKEFDSAQVDGRPMYLKIVGAPPLPQQRVAIAPPQQHQSRGFGGGRIGGGNGGFAQRPRMSRGGARPTRGGRGRGAPRGGRGGGRAQRKPREETSAEDLDKEMDEYRSQTAAAKTA